MIEKGEGCLWWAGKELMPEKSLEDYVGKNEKTKIVVKLAKVPSTFLNFNFSIRFFNILYPALSTCSAPSFIYKFSKNTV